MAVPKLYVEKPVFWTAIQFDGTNLDELLEWVGEDEISFKLTGKNESGISISRSNWLLQNADTKEFQVWTDRHFQKDLEKF